MVLTNQSSLSDYIGQKRQEKKVLLMGHAVVGYPSIEENRAMLEIMKDAGVDIVELQMPFSEPIADGPAFVKANSGALESGMRVTTYFDFIRDAAGPQMPVLAMGYYNWPLRMGHEKFARSLQEAGGFGYIIPDLPPEEDSDLRQQCEPRGLTSVLLMTPTNSDERLGQIAAKAKGFVYCVARRGVTGRRTLVEDAFPFIERCRMATDLPLALGFGIRNGEDVRKLHGNVDIAIVGTQLLKTWEESKDEGYLKLLEELVDACRG